jgi:hypothetical protein
MATNQVMSDVESQRYVAEVGNDVAPGSPRILGGVPVVTITGSGDYDGNAITVTANGVTTVLAGGRGGVGLADNQATVSPTGAYAFNVTGASAAAVTPGVTVVYLTSGNVPTLTSSGNTRFGVAEFFRGELSATDTVVRIGV